jgi:RNA polymerase sigma factor (sigma-70 family)
MTGTRPAELLRHLEQPGADDRALVNRYASHNDQAAFAELVRRHGPLVWAACLRVAGHRQDAEDAFQAAFLVLVRRCAAIRNLDLLGNWLYGVAVRVAMKARRSAARRRAREVQVPTMPDPPSPAVEADTDLGAVLDEELAALPAWYRDAVVLCDLRGVSRDEAARLLGVPEGTLSSRLANGRKRLAARLAKRGVALSAAAVPSALGQGARAAVPPELVAAVCRVANGSAVPPPVTRLASGDFAMTKLLFGLAGAVVAAIGAVYATQAADPPKPTDPPRPASVARGDPAVEQKPDPEAKPVGKAAYTTQPKLRVARDYKIGNVYALEWSPDGNILAVAGSAKEYLVQVDGPFEPDGNTASLRPGQIALEATSRFVGFTPDGRELVTEQRERELVSGHHRLRYWVQEPPMKGSETFPKVVRTVDLDAGDTHGYAFAADGKTFRTIAYERDGSGAATKFAVQEVDAATGKTLKTLLRAEGGFRRYALSDHGKRLSLLDVKGTLAVHDVDTGKSLWTKSLEEQPGREGDIRSLQFSPDGRRLAVFGGETPYRLYDATTGKPLAKFEKGEEFPYPGASSFTADGRLLAASLDQGTSGPPEYLCVWDCNTGKLLKKWDRKVLVAFHPSKPILAIIEANGENKSRLGLWDFAAEVEKK